MRDTMRCILIAHCLCLAPTRARKRKRVRVLRTSAVHACRRLSAQNRPISSNVTSEHKKTLGIIGVVLKELWGKTKEFKNGILGKPGGIMCSFLAATF